MLDVFQRWLSAPATTPQVLALIGLTWVPWVELRGSIPLAVALGWHPLAALALCVAANWVIIVPGYYALELFYERGFSRIAFVRRVVERVRARGQRMVARHQWLGLALFVAIPLPGTGAYAGTLLAWLLGMSRVRAWLAVAAGVLAAGLAITLAASGAAAALRRVL